MKISKDTFNAMVWGSLLIACTAAIFFPTSRIMGIIALAAWIIVIVFRPRPKARRTAKETMKKQMQFSV
jgi:hypothetical protein